MLVLPSLAAGATVLASGDAAVAHDASGMASYGWLMIALPLLGAAVLLLGGRALDKAAFDGVRFLTVGTAEQVGAFPEETA